MLSECSQNAFSSPAMLYLHNVWMACVSVQEIFFHSSLLLNLKLDMCRGKKEGFQGPAHITKSLQALGQ